MFRAAADAPVAGGPAAREESRLRSEVTGRSALRAGPVPGHPFYRLHRGEP
ncbi:hypothetical protein Ppa06_20670 [Planomonospora parontospora subsp. parontospora]|uniref:Uncharacterized protein n=2 Tax=Planomonospora parontospora TaxID=58119 RepID=A0AA37F410_9ACTN|nr:hypothetical protein [Planomonospora parontospora]GGK62986.1 hypothetical protein GCM10010126_22880 [Planomonospora parontospora]GII08269.1 hypothetical protein Ppa06_20670 [Planomonospora parontospora subsp. parontospora]